MGRLSNHRSSFEDFENEAHSVLASDGECLSRLQCAQTKNVLLVF